MNLQLIKEWWISVVSRANQFGIPLPMVRDPKTGRGDVALTLVVMSSALIMAGIIGKWSGHLGGVDVPQALQFFYASSALYWARKLKSDGKEVELDGPSQKSEEGSQTQGEQK